MVFENHEISKETKNNIALANGNNSKSPKILSFCVKGLEGCEEVILDLVCSFERIEDKVIIGEAYSDNICCFDWLEIQQEKTLLQSEDKSIQNSSMHLLKVAYVIDEDEDDDNGS